MSLLLKLTLQQHTISKFISIFKTNDKYYLNNKRIFIRNCFSIINKMINANYAAINVSLNLNMQSITWIFHYSLFSHLLQNYISECINYKIRFQITFNYFIWMHWEKERKREKTWSMILLIVYLTSVSSSKINLATKHYFHIYFNFENE